MSPAREPDDSGIDSDDALRRMGLVDQRLPYSDDDDTSTDDEIVIPSPTTHRRNERKAVLKKIHQKEQELAIMQWTRDQYLKDQNARIQAQNAIAQNAAPQNAAGEPSQGRASPPLYEVELTASEEDDDASVLELVIPMHTSRYQRVPTSSPKKAKPKAAKRYLCSMICCGRK